VSRRPLPGSLGTLPAFVEAKTPFGGIGPGSPSLPVFARRKRHVFKGPGSPAAFGRAPLPSNSRPGSLQGRTSGERITGITEEDEDEEMVEEEMAWEKGEDVDEDGEMLEEVDQFGPALGAVVTRESVRTHEEPETPVSPFGLTDGHGQLPNGDPHATHAAANEGGQVPLTAKALAKMEEEVEAKDESAAAAAAAGSLT